MATTELPRFSPAASGRAGGRALQDLAALSREKLARWAKAEAGRGALWAPVAIGAGAAFYFGLKTEPSIFTSLALLAAAGGAWGARRENPFLGACFLIALGFVAAALRTASVDAPALAREMRPTTIVGRLVSVEEEARSRRFVVEIDSIAGLDGAATPKRARITWRGKGFDARPGDIISFRAGLSPPPPPAAPGSFDFARQLYFQRIGAVGYAVTAPAVVEASRDFPARLAAAIEAARLSLARRILDKAPGEGGAIVAAVVTGKRGAISEASKAALRDSGLAHLLAISGLHMGLATGLIFFAIRLALAAVEPLALRYPIKKWAAGAALLSGFAYLLLSGAGWSAQRAFIMSSIFFIAILVDRRALSLRNVAIAATAIILYAPEAVLHPGFQMSFAAVTALIAAYEWQARRADPMRSFTLLARLRRYGLGVAATDVIASTATAPYSFYHFNRAAVMGLAANMVAVPLMGFVVMPAAIVAILLMPFGLDGSAWRIAAQGVDVILAVGGFIAAQKGAVATVAQWPPMALGVLTFGGLWLCLQTAPWRLGGIACLPFAALAIAAAPPPSLFLSREGTNVGIVAGEGLALFNPRSDKFAAGVWKEHVGLDRDAAPTRSLAEIGRCDEEGCVVSVNGATVAVSNDPLGLSDDCARADLVIALYPAPRGAPCAARLLDRRAAWAAGAHAIWISKAGLRVRSIRETQGARPWSAGQSSGAF
ncbi:MAG: ComEC/Rec2 family competence protein [Amphiplicatus sp.]